MTHESWSGPLPPPAIMEQYRANDPELYKYLIDSAEKQGDHRRTMELNSIDAGKEEIRLTENRDNKDFQIRVITIGCTTLILLCAIAGGLYAAFNGYESLGMTIVITAFAAGAIPLMEKFKKAITMVSG